MAEINTWNTSKLELMYQWQHTQRLPLSPSNNTTHLCFGTVNLTFYMVLNPECLK